MGCKSCRDDYKMEFTGFLSSTFTGECEECSSFDNMFGTCDGEDRNPYTGTSGWSSDDEKGRWLDRTSGSGSGSSSGSGNNLVIQNSGNNMIQNSGNNMIQN